MGFLVPLVAGTAFAATTAGALVATGLNIVATAALSVVAGLLSKKSASATGSVGGLETTITVEPDTPRSLIVGRTVVAGSLAFAGTSQSYGRPGSTEYRENILLTQIIALADHPVSGFDEIWIDGEKSTYAVPAANSYANATIGRNITCDLYDGRQTAADGVAVGLYAATDNPWPASAVGHGVAYARVSALYLVNVLDGIPTYKFVVRGIALYDPRRDTTVGGSGSHRFDDISTHEYTANPIVIIYNILRGIRVADGNGVIRHFYGLEGLGVADLPLDVWFAAMAACDEAVDNGDGTAGPRFQAGGEIPVDTAPMDAVDALLATCNGKRCEIGGIHEVFVGAPGAPVLTITDDDLLAGASDTFDVILPQGDRVNAVAASYADPTTWERADAPLWRSEAYEALDGRRLTGSLSLDMVTSLPQVQRVQREVLEESRRQRKHSIPLPPWAMVARPGRAVRWYSARNGYDGKLFRVDGQAVASNLDVTLQLTELDPADYDWSPGYYLPRSDGTYISLPPTARGVGGFSAEGAIWYGTGGQQRPAILLTWEPPGDDVERIDIELRRRVDTGQDAEPRVTDVCSTPQAGAFYVLRDLQRLTWYQVRARPAGTNGWEGEWSLWLDVQTLATGYVNLADLGAELVEKIAAIDDEGDTSLALAQEVIERLTGDTELREDRVRWTETLREETDDKDGALHVTLTTEIAAAQAEALAAVAHETSLRVTGDTALAQDIDVVLAAVGDVQAAVMTESIARADADGAQATLIEQAQARADEGTAEGRLMFDAVVGPGGLQSRIRLLARVNGNAAGGLVQAGLYVDTDSGGTVVLEAARTVIMSSSGAVAAYFDASGKVAKSYIPIITSDMITTGVLIADSAQIGSLVVGESNIGLQAVSERQSAGVSDVAYLAGSQWQTLTQLGIYSNGADAHLIGAEVNLQLFPSVITPTQYRVTIDGGEDYIFELPDKLREIYTAIRFFSAGAHTIAIQAWINASGLYYRYALLNVMKVKR